MSRTEKESEMARTRTDFTKYHSSSRTDNTPPHSPVATTLCLGKSERTINAFARRQYAIRESAKEAQEHNRGPSHKFRPGARGARQAQLRSLERRPPGTPQVFARLVAMILRRAGGDKSASLSPRALDTLHTATEDYLVHLLVDARLCAHHAGRQTITLRDLQRACWICGIDGDLDV